MTGTQKKHIGYIGSGQLFQTVQPYLEQQYQVHFLSVEDLGERAALASTPRIDYELSMVLYCDDYWHLQTQYKLNQDCLTLAIPWLRAYCEFGVGIIGPTVFPAETGCVACVETRRRAAMKDATDFVLLSQESEQKHLAPMQPWLMSTSLATLAQLVLREVAACLNTPDTAQTRRALLCLNLDTLHCQRHRFLPEPECLACGQLPQDTAEAAIIGLQSRPKLKPDVYRTRSLTAHAEAIFADYVDTQTGLISALTRTTDVSIAMVAAWIGISSGERSWQMNGAGRTLNYEQSKLAAIAEALERYGGQRPKGKRTAIQASYRQLGEQALDPTTLGLHTPEQYTLPQYRYVPYQPDVPCSWVWGYSFQRQRPILVPEHVAYYGSLIHAGESAKASFVYELSNGCALGNCLEEAIFWGILEVAERDAFLMTWYAQLGLSRLDLQSATDPAINLVRENLERASGYTIMAWNSTLDHGAPCCFVMAIDEQNRADMPKALCAAGSHPNPEHAVLNALLELDLMVKRPYNWDQAGRAKALEMFNNPLAVKKMEDHSLLYFSPEAFSRFNFLTGGTERRSLHQQTFQAAFSDFYSHEPNSDLRDDLCTLIEHYLARDIDIIVVDQTTPEHMLQAFRCVKVIMPGMLPMTFGHQYRRNSGFRRLADLPAQLGYRSGPLSDADINPHPHPFP